MTKLDNIEMTLLLLAEDNPAKAITTLERLAQRFGRRRLQYRAWLNYLINREIELQWSASTPT
jgi:hypothetical protein